MKSKTMFFGAAATAIALSAATISASPAQALNLSGTLDLQGKATVPDFKAGNAGVGQKEFAKFAAPTFVDGSSDFASFGVGGITIKDLELTLLTQTPIPGGADRTFSSPALTPFIDFGLRTIGGVTSNLTFNLLAGNHFGFKTNKGGLNLATIGALAGDFQFKGTTVAGGTLALNRSQPKPIDGRYTITLTAQPIPTPALLPGLIGLGMGVLRKRKKEMAGATAEA